MNERNLNGFDWSRKQKNKVRLAAVVSWCDLWLNTVEQHLTPSVWCLPPGLLTPPPCSSLLPLGLMYRTAGLFCHCGGQRSSLLWVPSLLELLPPRAMSLWLVTKRVMTSTFWKPPPLLWCGYLITWLWEMLHQISVLHQNIWTSCVCEESSEGDADPAVYCALVLHTQQELVFPSAVSWTVGWMNHGPPGRERLTLTIH